MKQHNRKSSRWQPQGLLPMVMAVLWIATMVLALSLGAWQLRRADQKKALLDHLHVNETQAVSGDARLLRDSKHRFRRLRLRGHFDTQHPVWQASQMHAHQLGYHIWMPFKVASTKHTPGPWIWVHLGWVPQGPDRKPSMPTWQPSPQQGIYEGIVDLLPSSKVPWVGQQAMPESWPVVTVHPNWQTLNQRLQRPFYPLSWRLSPATPATWVRQHTWVVMPPVRHVGYAVQWFGLALALLLCGAWFIYKKGR